MYWRRGVIDWQYKSIKLIRRKNVENDKMKQIKFIILFSIYLLASNQKLLSQDLTGFRFICEKTQNRDSILFEFRSHVFYLKEIRWFKPKDTMLTYTRTFRYSIDSAKSNENVFIYNFNRSYSSDVVLRTYTVYGQLQYHRINKTLTLTYYGKTRGEKEIGRVYSYSIKNIEKS